MGLRLIGFVKFTHNLKSDSYQSVQVLDAIQGT